MLAYFVFGIFLLLAVVIGSQALVNADPKKLARAVKLAAACGLGLAALFFAFTGRFGLAAPLGLAALWLLRNKPLFGSRPSPGQKSAVETEWLVAELDHDTGDMDAIVKQGQFEGKHLSDLSREQLADLLIELKEDQESVALLESYIDRNFNEDFSDHTTDQSNKDTGIFSRRDALDILELDDSASAEDIRAAHRRLMKKYHPDHGGSAYMAAKLNEAKEFLLGK